MNSTQEAELRALGASLANHVRQANGRTATPTARQALVADLCGELDDLVIPLKDVVSRRSFESFLQLGDPQVGAAVQRDALLSELQKIYSPVVIERIAAVLNGFLDLVPTSHAASAAASSCQSDDSDHESSTGSQGKEDEAALPPHVARALASSLPFWLLLLPITGVLAAVIALFSVRNVQFCQLTGSCSAAPSASRGQGALAAALAAAEKLKTASSLDPYQRALNELESELERIPGQSLISDQQQQVDTLVDMARQGRRRVANEQGYLQVLRSVESSVDQAQRLTGVEREKAIESASQSLAGIPANSFAAVEAASLKARLEGLLPSKGSEDQPREPIPPPIQSRPSDQVQPLRRPVVPDREPARAPVPVAPSPVPPAPAPPAAQPAVPRTPAPQRREEPAAASAGSSQYKLPKAWEERRERRREIMENYSSGNAE